MRNPRRSPDGGDRHSGGAARPSVQTRELPAVFDVPMPGYRVAVSPGLLESAGALVEAAAQAHRYAIITDRTVLQLYGERLLASFATSDARIFAVPAGEASKSRGEWARITDEMLDAGFGRDSAVVTLGGGMVGDLGGFVAATYMRGIPFAQVPTTLLAMVDASVGGKTGVDTPSGKNVVGAFHQPSIVVVDPETLSTLPMANRRAGISEMIKHGVIADAAYFERVLAAIPLLLEGAGNGEAIAALVASSIEIKGEIVRRDEREQGLRKVLNFGHTVAHAIERASRWAIPHGDAVAIGMVLESRLAERIGVAVAGLSGRVLEAVERAGLPAERPPSLPGDALLAAMGTDKKTRRGKLAFALPADIGRMAGEDDGWLVGASDEDIRVALA